MHGQCFVAKYASQKWYTDLHFTEKNMSEEYKQFYLIAYIDDRMRKIMNHVLLKQKNMELTTEYLIHKLKK